MSGDDAFVELPEEIILRQVECEQLLAALDLGLELAAQDTVAWSELRLAQTIIIAKLWPELGDLLRDPDDED